MHACGMCMPDVHCIACRPQTPPIIRCAHPACTYAPGGLPRLRHEAAADRRPAAVLQGLEEEVRRGRGLQEARARGGGAAAGRRRLVPLRVGSDLRREPARVREGLRAARRQAHRGGRELLQRVHPARARPPPADRRGDGLQRRARHLAARHRPRAAAHRAEERRRLRLRLDRHGGHLVPPLREAGQVDRLRDRRRPGVALRARLRGGGARGLGGPRDEDRPRAIWARLRARRQEVQDALGRGGAAGRSARRGGESDVRQRGRAQRRACGAHQGGGGGARPRRAGRVAERGGDPRGLSRARLRRGQVRRPQGQPQRQLHLRLRPHARPPRQHRRVHALHGRAPRVHPAQGGRRDRHRGLAGAARPDDADARAPGRARGRRRAHPLPGGARARDLDPAAQPPVRVRLRPVRQGLELRARVQGARQPGAEQPRDDGHRVDPRHQADARAPRHRLPRQNLKWANGLRCVGCVVKEKSVRRFPSASVAVRNRKSTIVTVTAVKECNCTGEAINH
eukprot:scaffold127083_cov66-Phaeocystis_antarctica.AAC.9